MAWTDQDRPADVLRAIDALGGDLADPAMVSEIAAVLGLVAPERPIELEPPPAVRTVEPVPSAPGIRQIFRNAFRSAGRWVWRHPWRLLVFALAAFAVLALIVALMNRILGEDPLTSVVITVGAVLVAAALYLTVFVFLLKLGTKLWTRLKRLGRRLRGVAPSARYFVASTDLAEPVAPTRPPQPVVVPGRGPAIAHALASARVPTNRPDFGLAARRIAEGRSALPFQRERSMRLAHHSLVLLDIGEAMSPLRHDAQALLADIENTLSSDRCTIARFREDPEDGLGTGPVHTWSEYDHRLGPPGTRIIVLSDAGAACRHPNEARQRYAVWTALASEWRAAGAFPILLTPFADRYPPAFVASLPTVQWSEALTDREIHAVAKASS